MNVDDLKPPVQTDDRRLKAREHLKDAWELVYAITHDVEATFEELYDELAELELRYRSDE